MVHPASLLRHSRYPWRMRVTPSQITACIEAAFPPNPGVSFPGALQNSVGIGNLPTVSGLLALIERMPEDHLADLTPDEYRDWLVATAALGSSAKRWANLSERDRSSTGATVGALSALGKRFPLEVIWVLAKKCRDEAPSMSVSGLEFLKSDPDLRATLRQDITTARSTLANGEFKAASVMAGSVIEALLLGAVKQRAADIQAAVTDCEAAGVKFKYSSPDKWGLYELMHVAQQLGLIPDATRQAIDNAKDFRNLIHSGRAERTGTKATLGGAMLAVGAMLRVVEELGG